MTTLTAEREHLDRPGADAGDRAQPAPSLLRLAGVQIDATARNLASDAHERERASGGEVEGL